MRVCIVRDALSLLYPQLIPPGNAVAHRTDPPDQRLWPAERKGPTLGTWYFQADMHCPQALDALRRVAGAPNQLHRSRWTSVHLLCGRVLHGGELPILWALYPHLERP